MKVIIAVIGFIVLSKLLFALFEHLSLYYPVRSLSQTPADIRVPYEAVSIPTSDGQTLTGWYVPCKGAEQTILYCHGNAGNISGRLHRVKFAREVGANLLIFDYRGYGQSTGHPTEQGLYHDIRAAYRFLSVKKHVNPKSVLLYGKSLGCAVALDFCVEQEVGFLVLESPFLSVAKVAHDFYPFLPTELLVSQRYDNERKIGKITTPLLIVHGRYDRTIRFQHAEKLLTKAREPRELIAYDGGHNDITFVTSKSYQKIIKKRLLRCERTAVKQGEH